MNLKPLLGAACAMICVACSNHKPTVPSFITENVEFAKAQLGLAIDTIEASGKCLNPVSIEMDLYITADMPIGAVDFFPVASGICTN